MGIYPFVDGKLEDFQEIFDKLIAVSDIFYHLPTVFYR